MVKINDFKLSHDIWVSEEGGANPNQMLEAYFTIYVNLYGVNAHRITLLNPHD